MPISTPFQPPSSYRYTSGNHTSTRQQYAYTVDHNAERSEYDIACDDRLSTGERFRTEEQIRQEVERALNAQKRSRARKAAAYTHRSQTESSMENSPYDRESIIDRARARQNSVYTKNTIPHRSLSRSDHDGLLPSGSSRSHAAGQTSPHDFASLPVRPPSSPKKPAFSSRFNPFKKVDNPSSNSACDDESVSDERSDTEPSGPWRKKLEHVAVIAILGYDPDAKQRPWFQKEMI